MTETSSPHPGPGAAPDQLEQVRRFLNSDDRFNGIDWLATEELAVRAGYPVPASRLPEVRRARAVLRSLAEDDGPVNRARATELAARHPLTVSFGADCSALAASDIVGFMLGLTHEAMTKGQWNRLGFCDNPDCQWSYYDTSRNRSQRWCSMNECGEVMKARAYRQRRKATAQPTG